MSSYISSKKVFKISRQLLFVLILHFIFDFFIGKTAHLPPVKTISSGGRYNSLFLHVFEIKVYIIFFQSTPSYWHFDLKSIRVTIYCTPSLLIPFVCLC